VNWVGVSSLIRTRQNSSIISNCSSVNVSKVASVLYLHQIQTQMGDLVALPIKRGTQFWDRTCWRWRMHRRGMIGVLIRSLSARSLHVICSVISKLLLTSVAESHTVALVVCSFVVD
jgi:hypothetical protein